jgi:hypothetical protein
MEKQSFRVDEIKPGIFRLSIGDFDSRERALAVACELAESTYPQGHAQRIKTAKYRSELQEITKRKETLNSKIKHSFDSMVTR